MVVVRIADGFRATRELAIEIVFPPRCAGCGHRGHWVCAECLRDTKPIGTPICPRCGARPWLCICDNLPQTLIWVRAAGWYEGWLGAAIRSFKYEGERARCRHLAVMLAPLLEELPPETIVVPVPLHPKREQDRGYNQAALLVAELARTSGRQTANPLNRDHATGQQVRLGARERAQNVQGAFSVKAGEVIQGKRFVLVDDVVTTGATIGECASVLAAAGAAWVGAVAIARER